MKNRLTFSCKNLTIAIFLFLIEILIATKLNDYFFVRAYMGDVLVVMLIYYFVKSFFDLQPLKLIIGIFIFACSMEFLQYFHFAELFGFKDNPVMMTVLGNSFSWLDVVCYFVGSIILYLMRAIKWERRSRLQ
ncbi:MAG: DUF2809 domain-containing protein [Weeksellaceae bacterium]|nr:DUF2809 domain-containing protein [Weeksellaceae bacterium]